MINPTKLHKKDIFFKNIQWQRQHKTGLRVTVFYIMVP